MNALDMRELLDGVEGDDHLYGRTVGVGNDPSGAHQSVGTIDLGDD